MPFSTLAALLVGLLLQPRASAQHPGPRPNLVLFMVDDLGWQDTSLPLHSKPTAFNKRYRSPNLERLARQGVRFTRAYACAVCSPTRSSLISGQNAARHRVTNWTLRKDGETSGRTQRLGPPKNWRRNGLQPDPALLPQLLHDAGYFCIHAGKAHWGSQGTPGADPRKLGFDRNIGGHHAGGPGHYSGLQHYGALRKQKIWAVPGLERYHGLPVHLTDALTIESLAAVDQALAKKQPFFLYLAHYAVHAPLQPHDPYTRSYRKAGLDEAEARYAAMIEGVDRSLGALLRHLERRGVAAQTLVVFTSDNGGLSAHARGASPYGGRNTHNRPLRAGKGSAYEGGIRVPMVAAWAAADPRQPCQRALPIEANAACHAPTLTEDLYPSLLRWAAVTPPSGAAVDGRDFSPLLQAQSRAAETDARLARPLVFHYPHVWYQGGLGQAQGYEPHSSMILGSHKLIYFYETGRWELYDLATDLGETRNLATEQAELCRRLARRLIEELQARGAQYPTLRSGPRTGQPAAPRVPG